MSDVEKRVREVFALFHSHGDHMYCGENVTQTSHMIQTAMNAEKDGQPPEAVLGALLHDIGNLVGHQDESVEKVVVKEVNIGPKHHDAIGEAFLKNHGFPLEIYCFCVGHVDAIRYMASKKTDYVKSLGWTSQQVLERKGGPMSEEEARKFEALPHYDAIVNCRKWDEASKGVNKNLQPLEKYEKMAVDYLKRGKT